MILSAGMVVVRREQRQWRYLLLRAYRNWDFPKGVVEPGEDPLEAALREVREETGITDLRLLGGGIYHETEPYYSGGKKIARYYLAETGTSRVMLSVNPEIGRPEHHEYRWLRSAEVKNLVSARLLGIIDWAEGVVHSGVATSAQPRQDHET